MPQKVSGLQFSLWQSKVFCVSPKGALLCLKHILNLQI
nr:MAG TPA: hypothetical protein [Inoviridae sp.]DAX48979.1 MAG TPA: hypothetical protein [Inoviridae sp.]